MNPGARATDNIAWADDPVRESRWETPNGSTSVTVTYTYTGIMADGTEVPLLPYNNQLPIYYGELPESLWMELPLVPATLPVVTGRRAINVG